MYIYTLHRRLPAPESDDYLQIIKATCAHLGLPLKWEKVEGPCTEIVFLGIILDTIRMELRLPQEKVHQLTNLNADRVVQEEELQEKRVAVPNRETCPCVQDSSSGSDIPLVHD